jgi:hypothetical protein
MGIKLYYKEYNSLCNFLNIDLMLPIISIKPRYDYYFKVGNTLSICFDTRIVYSSDDIGWHFTGEVLGFGIEITRQNTY